MSKNQTLYEQTIFDLLNRHFLPRRRTLLAGVLPEFPEELLLVVAQYAWKHLFEPSEGLFASSTDDLDEYSDEHPSAYVYNKDIITVVRNGDLKSNRYVKYVLVSDSNDDMAVSNNPPIIVSASNCVVLHIYDRDGEDEFYSMMGCLACGGCGFTAWKLPSNKSISSQPVFVDSNPRTTKKDKIDKYQARHNVLFLLQAPPDVLAKFLTPGKW